MPFTKTSNTARNYGTRWPGMCLWVSLMPSVAVFAANGRGPWRILGVQPARVKEAARGRNPLQAPFRRSMDPDSSGACHAPCQRGDGTWCRQSVDGVGSRLLYHMMRGVGWAALEIETRTGARVGDGRFLEGLHA